MIPDFVGQTIDIARIDWELHLWTNDNWEFVISQPVLVTTSDADGVHQTEVDVAVEAQPLPASLAGIEGNTITQVLVSREGDLGIQLSDRQLTVRASPHFEAWQVIGHDGEMFICAPGGDLTHFPPLRREAPDS